MFYLFKEKYLYEKQKTKITDQMVIFLLRFFPLHDFNQPFNMSVIVAAVAVVSVSCGCNIATVAVSRS